MDDRAAMLDQIKRFYAARDRGAVDESIAAFHPEAVFTLAGDTSGGFAGSSRGHLELRDTAAKLIAAFQFSGRRILSELVEGDRVVVHSRLTVRSAAKDIEQETEMLDLFRLRDGKIVEMTEFADTALAASMVA